MLAHADHVRRQRHIGTPDTDVDGPVGVVGALGLVVGERVRGGTAVFDRPVPHEARATDDNSPRANATTARTGVRIRLTRPSLPVVLTGPD